MSYNPRVAEQQTRMLDARGTAMFLVEKERYWQVLEEELTKEPMNGWIDLEDPMGYLIDTITFGDDKDRVADALADYIRFSGICQRAGSFDHLLPDEELIARATAYIR